MIFGQRPATPMDRKVYVITLLGLFFGLSAALLTYVMSTYFQQAIHSDNVGIFYFIASIVSLFALLQLHKLFLAFGRGRTLIALLFAQIVILFALTMLDISLVGAIFMMGYYFLYSVVFVLWDVVLEAYSTDASTGRIRGMFLSFTSLGWLVGPLLSTVFLERYGFHFLFFIVLILYMIMFLCALFVLNDIAGHNKPQQTSIKKMLGHVYRTKSLFYIYLVAVSVRFFYAIMTIFVPLYMRSLGMSWYEIGLIFTMMLVPLVVLEYPAGVLADKKWGEKELLIVGVVIMIVATVSIIFLSTKAFWLWAVVLIVSRIGTALVEAMRDAYFYKKISRDDTALINFFRTSRSVAYIIAAMLATSVQIFFGVRGVFVVLVVILVATLYPILRLHDTQPR